MPAQKRNGVVTSASETANSNRPVRKITCGANGTHDGVIDSSFSGTAIWAIPAATYSAAMIQRMIARWPALALCITGRLAFTGFIRLAGVRELRRGPDGVRQSGQRHRFGEQIALSLVAAFVREEL